MLARGRDYKQGRGLYLQPWPSLEVSQQQTKKRLSPFLPKRWGTRYPWPFCNCRMHGGFSLNFMFRQYQYECMELFVGMTWPSHAPFWWVQDSDISHHRRGVLQLCWVQKTYLPEAVWRTACSPFCANFRLSPQMQMIWRCTHLFTTFRKAEEAQSCRVLWPRVTAYSQGCNL